MCVILKLIKSTKWVIHSSPASAPATDLRLSCLPPYWPGRIDDPMPTTCDVGLKERYTCAKGYMNVSCRSTTSTSLIYWNSTNSLCKPYALHTHTHIHTYLKSSILYIYTYCARACVVLWVCLRVAKHVLISIWHAYVQIFFKQFIYLLMCVFIYIPSGYLT